MTDLWTRKVNQVKDHVRSHLVGDLKLETLANVAHSSPYHFHRIFKAVCGETLAEFTRRARLERAAYLMKATPERKLSAVALEVGFPALPEFSRAFKKHYGCSPQKWDRTSALNSMTNCGAGSVHREQANRQFETVVVRHHACRLAYIRMQTWFQVEKLKVGFDRLTRWLEEKGVDWREQKMVGMSWDHYQTTPLEKVQYDLAFPVPDHIISDSEIGIYTLPSFQAVEVHCKGRLDVVAQAWDYLYDNWFVRSSYEPADLPAMKRFRRRPDEIGWHTWDLDCSIALKPGLH